MQLGKMQKSLPHILRLFHTHPRHLLFFLIFVRISASETATKKARERELKYIKQKRRILSPAFFFPIISISYRSHEIQ